MNELYDSILLEGSTYILDISSFSEKEKKYWVEKERLKSHISYHPKNSFATVKFVNVVGNVNLFGRTMDIRSPKFFDGHEGNKQFKLLVADLNEISSQLTYSYTGVSSVRRDVDNKSFNPSDIERFDYFYQFTFNFPPGNNLDSLMNKVLSSPNRKTVSYEEMVPISKSKKISKRCFQEIGKSQHFTELTKSHSLFQSNLAQRIQAACGIPLIPINVLALKNTESFDTPENRFIKFFLEEIKSICYRLNQVIIDKGFRTKIYELKSRIESFLQLLFFREIGRLNYFPDSSSVLLNRAGYRELYYHFVQSKFGFTSIVDNLEETSMTSGLKDMAALYEIWVFFELGKRLFNSKEIKQNFSTRGIKNGDVIRGISWTNSNIELKYNFSYSHRNNSSYSLSLRPDISLKIGEELYLFDAKYKFTSASNSNYEEEEIQRIIKAEDIHKMHAYLDAIESAKLSVAIYPGNKFIFYNKMDKTIAKEVSDVSFVGVGAIPLIPNSDGTILDAFILKLFTQSDTVSV